MKTKTELNAEALKVYTAAHIKAYKEWATEYNNIWDTAPSTDEQVKWQKWADQRRAKAEAEAKEAFLKVYQN